MPAPKEGEYRGFYAERITAKVMTIMGGIILKDAKDRKVILAQEQLKELFMDEYVEVEDRKK